eukprot:gene28318-37250_t
MNQWDYSLFSNSRDFKRNLLPVSLKDLNPTARQVRRGNYLKLTIINEGFLMTAFQCTGRDENGDEVRLSIYNLPTGGTAHTMNFKNETNPESILKPVLGKTLFKPETVVFIKDPWFKYAMDGGTAVRVEDCKDIAFVRSSTSCSYCETTDKKLKTCGRCGGAFYCSATCQTTDWKLHKKVCRSYIENQEHHATKMQANGI